MRWTPMTLAILALAGCGSGKDTASPNTGNVVPPGVTTGESDSGGPVGPGFMEPAAIGFEVLGVIHADGTLHPQKFPDGTEQPPLLMITFADIQFFDAVDDISQAGHFCEVAIDLSAIVPHDAASPAFTPYNGSVLNWSTELALDFTTYYQFAGTECGSVVDTSKWGVDGQGLLAEFQDARVGLGFGPMTDYQWDAWGGQTDPQNADFVDKPMAEYIALGDRNSNWGGCDWSSLVLYEVDPLTDIAVEDPTNPGYLQLPMDTINLGNAPMPVGLVRSFAYWYQDFDLISPNPTFPWDFTHLAGASGNGAPLCDQGRR